MPDLKELIDLFLHVDQHLTNLVTTYQGGTYLILFAIIFAETGLVVTPFLPGDSLLFAAGALAAAGALDLTLLLVLLSVAAIVGDALNYTIGATLGRRISPNSRIVKAEYLERTRQFYDRHGPKTIVLARFVPIVRTFAPFLAGIGYMSYRQFAIYNVSGALLWIFTMTVSGYLFGNLPIVEEYFELVVLGVIGVSLLPIFIEWLRGRRRRRDAGVDPDSADPAAGS
jgi:membrane-associated protein